MGPAGTRRRCTPSRSLPAAATPWLRLAPIEHWSTSRRWTRGSCRLQPAITSRVPSTEPESTRMNSSSGSSCSTTCGSRRSRASISSSTGETTETGLPSVTPAPGRSGRRAQNVSTNRSAACAVVSIWPAHRVQPPTSLCRRSAQLSSTRPRPTSPGRWRRRAAPEPAAGASGDRATVVRRKDRDPAHHRLHGRHAEPLPAGCPRPPVPGEDRQGVEGRQRPGGVGTCPRKLTRAATRALRRSRADGPAPAARRDRSHRAPRAARSGRGREPRSRRRRPCTE